MSGERGGGGGGRDGGGMRARDLGLVKREEMSEPHVEASHVLGRQLAGVLQLGPQRAARCEQLRHGLALGGTECARSRARARARPAELLREGVEGGDPGDDVLGHELLRTTHRLGRRAARDGEGGTG